MSVLIWAKMSAQRWNKPKKRVIISIIKDSLEGVEGAVAPWKDVICRGCTSRLSRLRAKSKCADNRRPMMKLQMGGALCSPPVVIGWFRLLWACSHAKCKRHSGCASLLSLWSHQKRLLILHYFRILDFCIAPMEASQEAVRQLKN